ncbi:MAG TPA: iron-sulfur cluster assembly scaffold protein [Pirellulales bacterium]|nr:iron-sulfur cluster assembly scaffold protein [Pirellulales bacterium]
MAGHLFLIARGRLRFARNLIFAMLPEEDELYQQRILDHYEEPFHRGHCPRATHAHEDENPLCGDVVRVELALDPAGKICEAWFNGEGCCISQASASMLVERMNGRSVEEARSFTAQDMLALLGAKLTPNRQKCCLLPWRALQSAIYSPVDDNGDGDKKCGGQ